MRQFESTRFTQLTSERKQRLAELLAKSQTFDNFMAKKFGTVKRYGAEGGESLMAFFDEVLHKSNGGLCLRRKVYHFNDYTCNLCRKFD